MHFWGLTIDVISCINLVIAVGLCVDYAAHIAHCYVVSKGEREKGKENHLKYLLFFLIGFLRLSRIKSP